MAKKVKITKGGQTVYPATVMDAVVHKDLRVDSSKLIEEVNVSKIFPTGGIDGSNKYTLETAIAMIPASLRSVGIKCSFLDEAGSSELWQHKGGAIDNVNNWAEIGNKRLTELSYTLYNVNQRTNKASTYFTLETAIATIPTADRFPVMAITFRSGSSSNPGNSFAVYLIGSVSDGNFLNVSNWIVWTDKIVKHESDIAQLKDDFKKTSDFYNVNQRTNTLTTYYTLETAIATIPEADRKALMWITFRTGSASNQTNSFAQYTGGNTADENFLDAKKWIVWTDRITQNESDIAQLKDGVINTDILEGIKSNVEYDYTNDVSFDTSCLMYARHECCLTGASPE